MTSSPSFPEFFQAVHGFQPFPWQARLAEQVVEHGWPALLDLPTGCGKTSALDVALYALAVVPHRAPRRIFLVVDRRIVVDQAATHARNILERMRAGAAPEVAHRLRALFDAAASDDPFAVAVMRGGMPREEAWARRPDQPVVAVSTVDQVGSRLLFRGYGVSDRMAPIHAGLLGTDVLYLMDEVHLATPFAETLGVIERRWRPRPLVDRFAVVRMSATPGGAEMGAFRLDERDRAHAILAPRLRARKAAHLKEVRVTGDEPERKGLLADACATEARALLHAGARVVGVVVNRVDTAREVWRRLTEQDAGADVVLLTGRMRPLDRDAVLTDLKVLERAGASRARAERPCPRPLVIVATQCIEAGADLDLEGLVTECASLDALRQRFGRLDRRGEGVDSRAIVLMRSDQTDPEEPDAVYASALARTWDWLRARGEVVGMGISELDLPEREVLAPLLAPTVHAPVVLPAHLDAWVQTSPRPVPDPDIALWLHGPERGVPEVQVVWRADVTEEDLAGAGVDGSDGVEARDRLLGLLTACPPSALEALALPIHAARAWLAGASEATEMSDQLGERPPEERRRAPAEPGVRALRWAAEDSDLVAAGDLRPGDVLVVPAPRGGLKAFNWDPQSKEAVLDLGDFAQLRGRSRGTLPVHPGALAFWGLDASVREAAPRVPEADDVEDADVVAAWLDLVPISGTAGATARWEELRTRLGAKPRATRLPNARYLLTAARGRQAVEGTTEDDEGSFVERETTLREHSHAVERWAGRFAGALGLAPEVAADVKLAGWLHDAGKADPRFQRWLVGGSEVRLALMDEPLAKSRGGRLDRASREEERRRAGFPRGYRHELLSVALVERSAEALAAAADRELVLHLVGSHHGWCRPFAPAQDHPDDLPVTLKHGSTSLVAGTRHRLARLDSGVSDRFWALVERYGWWGLAWLEAILRLADHRASEEGGA